MSLKLIRLLTNPDDAILNGEDRQRSKASAPRMARLEPTWMYLRRLYDLACSLRRGHFVNNLNEFKTHEIHQR
ncbi:acetyltransferase [Yersinia pseudotuberculosis]|nr:acetyltransferase [Yersinia pseudotuberculosis]